MVQASVGAPRYPSGCVLDGRVRVGDGENGSSGANVIVQFGGNRIADPRQVDNIDQQQIVRRGNFAHGFVSRYQIASNFETPLVQQSGGREISQEGVPALQGPREPQPERGRMRSCHCGSSAPEIP